jgi:cell division transport system permease protein
MERALAALRALPGIADAEPVPPEEIHRLLRPWLKDDALAAELPLPALIDLRTVPGAPVPASVLGPKVAAAVHGAKLDDHGGWTGDLLALARTGEALGAFLFAAIGLAAAGTIAAASRARLAANGREIELMHTLGATDTYIARRFLAGPVRSTAIGAVIGAVIGFGVLAATRAVPMEAVPLLLQLRLTELDFAALTVVPIGAILLAAIVSGVAAYLSARRFP